MGKQMHKGHYGHYSGNYKFSHDHAHTKVTKENYKASERDDAAHIDYLKRDIIYDDHHGHSDEKMTADEKHISKLAGDMKYDKEHHGSPAHSRGDRNDHDMGPEGWKAHKKTMHGIRDHGGPNMSALPKMDSRMKYGHEDFDYDFASDAGVFDEELSDDKSVRRAQKRYRRKTK